MKPPIFIVGCPRSGTTLFRLILNAHSNIAIPGETWYFPTLYKKLKNGDLTENEELFQFIINSPVFREIGVSQEKLNHEVEKLDTPNLSEKMAIGHVAFMNEQNKIRWGDKTPDYLKYLPLLKDVFPEAYVIHIIRDGRDVSVSLIENKFLPSKNIYEAAYLWNSRIDIAKENGSRIFKDKFIEVKYEDLVENPKETVLRICSLIDEEYEPDMLKYFETVDEFILSDYKHHDSTRSPINKSKLNRYKNTFSKLELEVFSQISGHNLKHYNYDFEERKSIIAFILHSNYKLKLFRGRVYRFLKRKLKLFIPNQESRRTC